MLTTGPRSMNFQMIISYIENLCFENDYSTTAASIILRREKEVILLASPKDSTRIAQPCSCIDFLTMYMYGGAWQNCYKWFIPVKLYKWFLSSQSMYKHAWACYSRGCTCMDTLHIIADFWTVIDSNETENCSVNTSHMGIKSKIVRQITKKYNEHQSWMSYLAKLLAFSLEVYVSKWLFHTYCTALELTRKLLWEMNTRPLLNCCYEHPQKKSFSLDLNRRFKDSANFCSPAIYQLMFEVVLLTERLKLSYQLSLCNIVQQ